MVRITPQQTDRTSSNEGRPEYHGGTTSSYFQTASLVIFSLERWSLLSPASTLTQASVIALPSPSTAFHTQAKVPATKREKATFTPITKKAANKRKQAKAPSQPPASSSKWSEYARLQKLTHLQQPTLASSQDQEELNNPLARGLTKRLLVFGNMYRPESRAQKKQRLSDAAARSQTQEAENNGIQGSKKLYILKFGANHVAALAEARKAKLVVIAADATPPEAVAWIPIICRKRDVPYAIIHGQARLGTLVNKRTAGAVAFMDIRPEDMEEFNSLVTAIKAHHVEQINQQRKKWPSYSDLLTRSLLDL
ncbi:60S ribosomal protein L8B [Mortierella sp. NVP85]|nr:60S ribosomal protein L8B [Mortierella sp. NVP85]